MDSHRGAARAFFRIGHPKQTRHEPADFFWRRSLSEHGTTCRDFAAAVMFPDLPSGFWCVAFGRLSGFDGFPLHAKRPPNSGGEFRRALFARGVGWV